MALGGSALRSFANEIQQSEISEYRDVVTDVGQRNIQFLREFLRAGFTHREDHQDLAS